MIIKVPNSKILLEGSGAGDKDYLILSFFANYIFRAKEVYALRCGEKNELTEAYRVTKVDFMGTFNLLPIRSKKKLKDLTKMVLSDDQPKHVASRGCKVPKRETDNENTEPWVERILDEVQ